ncbi:thioredoxin family protein [Galbibacter sp. PAP.153]|uniref:thioredoxin family protein n=1 Tax=Galbibacter sp. PAP.153 TaxID=3104623 RepID=UPI0030083A5F
MKLLKLLLLVAVLVAGSAFSPPEKFKDGYKIGDKATDFQLKNVDGNMVSLSDYEDVKGYLVIFTCNSCPYANAYEDRIIALHEKYNEKGVPVIAINPNNPEIQPKDSYENMQQRAKEKGYSFPYLIDEGQKIFPVYGAQRTPHCFLLEKTSDGNVVKYIGAIDDNYQDADAVETTYVEDAIDAMLQGEEITIKNTKAIGCSIKV